MHIFELPLRSIRNSIQQGQDKENTTTMGTLFGVAAIILDIFALTDVMKSNRDTTTKVVLMVLILLFPIIAAGLYLLVFRDKGY